MANSLELREQRAALITESRSWLEKAEAEGRPNSEIENEWSTRNQAIDKLESDIKSLERKEKLESHEAELRQSAGRKTTPASVSTTRDNRTITKQERNKALKAWMGQGRGIQGMQYDGETMNRCADLGLNLSQSTINCRSMVVGTNTAGGYGTFVSYFPDLQTEIKYYSPIIDKVRVLNTSDGNNFVMPRATDVANTMAIVSEGGSSGTSTDPTFDRVTLGSYLFRYIELVSYEMLADAVFDLEGWLSNRLAERAARTLEKYIVNGTGSSQPTGLKNVTPGTTVTLASGHNAFYTFDDLMTLFSSVDLAYRPNCTLVLADSSVWALRKIKDSQNRYIWDVNNTLVQNAQPDSIAGFKYLISNSMDASGAFSHTLAVFADLSRYICRMVDGVQITRLNELYRATGCIGFEVLMRFDGNYIGHANSIAAAVTPAS